MFPCFFLLFTYVRKWKQNENPCFLHNTRNVPDVGSVFFIYLFVFFFFLWSKDELNPTRVYTERIFYTIYWLWLWFVFQISNNTSVTLKKAIVLENKRILSCKTHQHISSYFSTNIILFAYKDVLLTKPGLQLLPKIFQKSVFFY